MGKALRAKLRQSKRVPGGGREFVLRRLARLDAADEALLARGARGLLHRREVGHEHLVLDNHFARAVLVLVRRGERGKASEKENRHTREREGRTHTRVGSSVASRHTHERARKCQDPVNNLFRLKLTDPPTFAYPSSSCCEAAGSTSSQPWSAMNCHLACLSALRVRVLSCRRRIGRTCVRRGAARETGKAWQGTERQRVTASRGETR